MAGAACTGDIQLGADSLSRGPGTPGGAPGGDEASGPGAPGGEGNGTDSSSTPSSTDPAPLRDLPADQLCEDRSLLGQREPGVRRLTSVELKSSLRALFGDSVWQRVRPLAEIIPEDGHADTVPSTHTATQVNAIVEIANDAATAIVDDATRAAPPR
jgi:hypothetical protein